MTMQSLSLPPLLTGREDNKHSSVNEPSEARRLQHLEQMFTPLGLDRRRCFDNTNYPGNLITRKTFKNGYYIKRCDHGARFSHVLKEWTRNV